LFGHHHAAPTFASRVVDGFAAVTHLPLEVWLTVIPIVGGLAIAYVTHRLSVSRERLALRREDERHRADDERLAQRVRIDLSFRLNRHRDALRSAARSGDIARLAAQHDSLVRRATESEVIEALGKHYASLMSMLQLEEATLARLTDASDGSALATERNRAAELAGIETSLDGVTSELGLNEFVSSVRN
jgi:hypothetical protein